MINFRYNIIRSLGAGRGKVFLVEDLQRGKVTLALKAISLANLNIGEIDSLKNEFRILKQFNHPNIVKAYDFGEVFETNLDELKGTYFYTSEYIAGKNLLEFFREVNFENFNDVFNQICHVLFYIHQFGIIHYDIKPENILIMEEHESQGIQIKIIDFGFGGSDVENLRGTPAYVAPEILKHEKVDWRADLYSLGSTLYHVLEERPPFEADDYIDLFKKHLNQIPKSLSKNHPGYLNKIILKLLEKNPDNRYRNSLEILKDIPQSFISERNFEWYFPKVFVGREKEFKELMDFTSDEKSKNDLLLIFGEEGTGKSTLLGNIESALEESGKVVYRIENSETSFSAFDFWIRFLIKIENRLMRISPEKLILNEIKRLIDKLQSANGSSSKVQESLHNEILPAVLIKYSRQEKFVLLIDDYYNLDTASRDFFNYLRPSLAERGVKFILNFHPGYVNDDSIKALPQSEIMILNPFNQLQINELLRIYFKWNFPYEKIETLLIEFTDGTPRAINDFLGLLFLNRMLFYDENGFHINEREFSFDIIRSQVEKIHENKFSLLTRIQKDLLFNLSCFRTQVKIDELAEVSTYTKSTIKNEMNFFVSMGWIAYSESTRLITFSQKGFQKYIYSLFTEKVQTHRTIAEIYSKKNKPPALIAEQYHFAGLKSKAFEYYLKAAESSFNLFAYSLVENILIKAEENIENSEQEFELKKYFARCYYLQSEFKKALNFLTLVLEDPRLTHKEKFQFSLWYAIVQHKLGEAEVSQDQFDTTFNLAETDEEKIEVEINQINIFASLGNYSIVKKRCEDLLTNFENSMDEKIKASVYNNLGITHFMEGNFDLSMNYFTKSLELYSAVGDNVKISQLNLNLGNVLNVKAQRQDAIAHWKVALKLNEDMGNLQQKARILNNMGIAAYEDTEFEEAINYYRDAKDIFDRIGDNHGLGLALFNISETAMAMCDYSTVYENILLSNKLCRKLFDNEGLTQSIFYLGLVNYTFNRIEEAERLYKELEEFIELNKLQTSQLPFALYLSGILNRTKKNYTDSEIKLTLARELFKDNSVPYFEIKSSLELMYVYTYQGRYNEIVGIFNELNKNEVFNRIKVLKAEALFILGNMAKKPGAGLNKTPLDYYLEAMKLIENSPISEITWQLSFALGEEYIIKGVFQKGKQNLQNAKLLINYLSNNIINPEFRRSYLEEPVRQRTLKQIDRILTR